MKVNLLLYREPLEEASKRDKDREDKLCIDGAASHEPVICFALRRIARCIKRAT